MSSVLPSLADRFARRALMLQGYRSRFLSTSVGRVHALDGAGWGPYPPVVLLHGYSSTGVHFAPLLRRLRPHVRRLIIPDLPGHGRSDVPPAGMSPATLTAGLRESLDQLITEPSVVVGNSMGGLAALRWTLERPETVRGAVLVSPTGAAMSPDELSAFRDSFDLRAHTDALQFVRRVFGRDVPLRHVLAWGVREKFQQPAMRSLIAALTPHDLLHGDDLAELSVPAVVVWGQLDHVLPDASRAFWRRHLPAHVPLEEPAALGHSPYLDQPDALSQRIIDFLDALPPRQPQRATWAA